MNKNKISAITDIKKDEINKTNNEFNYVKK